MAEAGAVEVEAVEDVAVGRGEVAVGDPRGEAPPCLSQSRVEEQEKGLREEIGAGGVVMARVVLHTSLM